MRLAKVVLDTNVVVSAHLTAGGLEAFVLDLALRHPHEVEEYLAREQKAEEVRQRIESQQGDLSETRARCSTSYGREDNPAAFSFCHSSVDNVNFAQR